MSRHLHGAQRLNMMKCGLEEIVDEFILWDRGRAREDGLRLQFIDAVLGRSFPREPRPDVIGRFLEAYEAVYRRQQLKPGFDMETAASPGNIRQLVAL